MKLKAGLLSLKDGRLLWFGSAAILREHLARYRRSTRRTPDGTAPNVGPGLACLGGEQAERTGLLVASLECVASTGWERRLVALNMRPSYMDVQAGLIALQDGRLLWLR